MTVLLVGCGNGEESRPAAAEIVNGTDLTFTLPEGWTVTTDADGPAAGGSALDVQIVRNGNRGIQPTINVIDLKEQSRPGEGLRELAELTLDDVTAHPAHAGLPPGTRIAAPEGPSGPERLRIDGEPALRYHRIARFESEQLLQELIVVDHEGAARSVSLTTDPGSAESSGEALAEMLDSWRWDR